MTKTIWAAVAAVMCCFSLPALGGTHEAATEEERLLGTRNPDQHQNHLPFTRRLNAGGVVEGSLDYSSNAAGVPPVAALEVMRAFGTAIDLETDVADGDTFRVAYDQEYTIEGHPIGVPRVAWA